MHCDNYRAYSTILLFSAPEGPITTFISVERSVAVGMHVEEECVGGWFWIYYVATHRMYRLQCDRVIHACRVVVQCFVFFIDNELKHEVSG